ncbi:MAG TPA: hypothetical protein VMM93_14875 [Vicinamibacterales bacterium]|nr:hypothetical protein [Vicinamibacterales bacterium]
MSGLIQDLVVGLVSLGAAVYVARQIVGVFRPESTDAACDHCNVPGEPPPDPPRDPPR